MKAAPSREFSNRKVYKGVLLGLMALRAVRGKSGPLQERLAKKIVKGDSTVLARKVAPETVAQIELLTRQTRYWHGTGRFQYRDGKIVDVLQGMIDQGGLTPQPDDVDMVGPMDSISLARSRTYSRIYADLHRVGDGGERHGSALLWASAFISPLALKVFQEEKLWRPENRRRVWGHLAASNSARWYRKVLQEPIGTRGVLARGSDIEDNYPILFGIKEEAVTPTRTSTYAAVHEVRSAQPIGFDDLTHIEIPAERVVETASMLAGAGCTVPVMAIEDFEAHSSQLSFKAQVT